MQHCYASCHRGTPEKIFLVKAGGGGGVRVRSDEPARGKKKRISKGSPEKNRYEAWSNVDSRAMEDENVDPGGM